MGEGKDDFFRTDDEGDFIPFFQSISMSQFFCDRNGMRVFQKEKTFLFGLIELIFSKGLITEDIDAEKIKGFSNGFVYFGDILNDWCGRFDSGTFFYLEINLFRKASSERGNLKIGFPRDMIDGGIEGFDGRVNG